MQIGQGGNVVTGELFVDYTAGKISGPGLNVEVLGQSVPLDATALTLQQNPDGSYKIVGATVGVGATPVANVELDLGSAIPPTSATAAVTAAGNTSTQAEVVTQVTCYASGTLIRTARGEVAVETLAIGDLVTTAAGAIRPVIWLGHRTIA